MYWCIRVLLHFSLHAIPKWTSEGKMAQNPVNFVIDLRIKKKLKFISVMDFRKNFSKELSKKEFFYFKDLKKNIESHILMI